LDRINYGVVSLVLKGNDADRIQKYRPICLLNVVFKIVTKILCNILVTIAEKVIKFTQTAFIKGRYILDGVVSLHEILNEVHKTKGAGVLFKIDFEKAFDKIKWPFLLQTLEMKGFPSKFVDWVMKSISGGKVAIRVNDENGAYFPTYQGLRQGDPMSPLLFDLAADALSIMIGRAVSGGLITGLGEKFIEGVWPSCNMQMTRSCSCRITLHKREISNSFSASLSKCRA
jgi:hypothetical protein